MNNWDLSKLKKDVKTEVASDLKRNLGRFTDSRNKIASGRSDREKEETGDNFEGFSAFRI